jgi:tripartite-type tricarboxylate transporter receptor subunit TctC
MKKLVGALAFAITIAASALALAQSYPSRPITIIVPFAPGGPTDTIARIMGERMKLSLGQPVIIENVGGAGGSIGVGRAVRASPDGYTISIGNSSSHVFNGAIYALPYDLLQDFEPVALLSTQPLLIVTRGTMAAKNLSEFIAWLKANPDVAAQGTPGAGTAAHVMGVFLQRETGARFQFVPYRGTGPAMQDLIANQIDFMIDTPTNSLPHVRAHTIKAYTVTAPTRLASAPDIPTVDEAGLPGFHFSFWQAFWVPKGTPSDMVAKLNAAVVETLADPDGTATLRGPGPGNSHARAADAAGARRLSQGRDREVVADRQGGEHQGGVASSIEDLREEAL